MGRQPCHLLVGPFESGIDISCRHTLGIGSPYRREKAGVHLGNAVDGSGGEAAHTEREFIVGERHHASRLIALAVISHAYESVAEEIGHLLHSDISARTVAAAKAGELLDKRTVDRHERHHHEAGGCRRGDIGIFDAVDSVDGELERICANLGNGIEHHLHIGKLSDTLYRLVEIDSAAARI